ncbi:ABC transporter ATP-binding protein [Bordetella genomosp. 7]|jgi:branched-chain amino acid transport system ATP-binding protein|uniref:ABC transporter ATP-binding protein n=1 Tax=Bordetella genomosp. 7 TaxID=1416805 RepID=A0A261RLN8_9BORD|nr:MULTISPECIES: ABC transporter ATP-binding protein [Bordetella]OZI24137.1 ABC transporter ATP-binding protein [Bordetella genomosp. 7]OZI25213.1 ABC transporter ATP-binding protein [Bordetella genomosp. 7]
MIDEDIILTVEDIDLGYGALQVVFGVSLVIRKNELVGLVGGNGSGKSTILRAVSGMIRPWKGRIMFKGEDIAGLAPHQMAERGLAHVPMGRQLFPNLSVKDNILLGAYLPRLRANRKASLDRVFSLFPDVEKFASSPAGSLSGGQQQMVAIGRALMLEPRLLIMDEPSLGLSPLYVKQVMQTIRRVADLGFPVLLVEQNIKQVLQCSDRAYVLENGRLVLDGPSKMLEGHPMIRKAYLGL